MKPQTGITLIALILLGVFAIYSSVPERTDQMDEPLSQELLKGNEEVVLGETAVSPQPSYPNTTAGQEDINPPSASELDEEWQSMTEGFSALTEELQSLEKMPSASSTQPL